MKIKSGFTGERALVLPRVILKMMEFDALLSVLHITDMGYYPCAQHHFRKREEPIEQYVFIYCVSGEGWYELRGKRYDVVANQYFTLPRGESHVYGASDNNPWTIYWIHYGGTMAPEFCPRVSEPQIIPQGLTSRIQQRISLFEEIFSRLSSRLTIESMRYAMGAFHHFLASVVYIGEYRAGQLQPYSPTAVDAAIHFMEENVERHLRLNEIAEAAGVSVAHLSAVFKERTGHSPINYFNLLKMRRACEYLEQTSMKLTQISFKIGIEDVFYFSRLFKRIMGMSPRAYRHRPKT